MSQLNPHQILLLEHRQYILINILKPHYPASLIGYGFFKIVSYISCIGITFRLIGYPVCKESSCFFKCITGKRVFLFLAVVYKYLNLFFGCVILKVDEFVES